MPQVSRPLAQACAPAVIMRHRVASPDAEHAKAERRRECAPRRRRPRGQLSPFCRPSAQASISICCARPITKSNAASPRGSGLRSSRSSRRSWRLLTRHCERSEAIRPSNGLLRRSAPRNDEADGTGRSLAGARAARSISGLPCSRSPGALLAAEKRQTLVTFIFFAVVTGVGGGTLRDLLIGAPVFWVHTNATLLICIGAALATWLDEQPPPHRPCLAVVRRRRPRRLRDLRRGQGAGYGVAPVPAFVMGVLTACAGGIIRDVLAGEPSILMRPELYVTAAALSAGLFVGPALRGRADTACGHCRRSRRLRSARPGDRPGLVAAGLSRLGLPHCSIAVMLCP